MSKEHCTSAHAYTYSEVHIKESMHTGPWVHILGSFVLLGFRSRTSMHIGCRRSRVVTFTAIRLRGPGFKPRLGQTFENETFCFRRTPAVVKACRPCRARLIKRPLYKT